MQVFRFNAKTIFRSFFTWFFLMIVLVGSVLFLFFTIFAETLAPLYYGQTEALKILDIKNQMYRNWFMYTRLVVYLALFIFIGIQAGAIFRREINEGTLLVILSKPISRVRLFFEKWLVLELTAIIMLVVGLLIPAFLAFIPQFLPQELLGQYFNLVFKTFAYGLFVQFIVVSVCMMVGLILGEKAGVIVSVLLGTVSVIAWLPAFFVALAVNTPSVNENQPPPANLSIGDDLGMKNVLIQKEYQKIPLYRKIYNSLTTNNGARIYEDVASHYKTMFDENLFNKYFKNRPKRNEAFEFASDMETKRADSDFSTVTKFVLKSDNYLSNLLIPKKLTDYSNFIESLKVLRDDDIRPIEHWDSFTLENKLARNDKYSNYGIRLQMKLESNDDKIRIANYYDSLPKLADKNFIFWKTSDENFTFSSSDIITKKLSAIQVEKLMQLETQAIIPEEIVSQLNLQSLVAKNLSDSKLFYFIFKLGINDKTPKIETLYKLSQISASALTTETDRIQVVPRSNVLASAIQFNPYFNKFIAKQLFLNIKMQIDSTITAGVDLQKWVEAPLLSLTKYNDVYKKLRTYRIISYINISEHFDLIFKAFINDSTIYWGNRVGLSTPYDASLSWVEEGGIYYGVDYHNSIVGLNKAPYIVVYTMIAITFFVVSLLFVKRKDFA